MSFIDSISYIDMADFDDDFELEEKPKKKRGPRVDSETLQQMRRADERQMRICYECNKKFSSRVPSGAMWPYKDKYHGAQRWYCSWTCISRNRKGRK